MGDRYWHIAYPGPAPKDVEVRMIVLADTMRARGLIAGEEDRAAILGPADGPVYRPGPKAEEDVPEGFRGLDRLLTNGVAFSGKPLFNYAQLNRPSFKCPACSADLSAERQVDRIGEAASRSDFGAQAVICAECGTGSAVNSWAEEPGFIIAGCGVTLWNWQVMNAALDPIRAAWDEVFPQDRVEDGGKL